MRMTDKLTRLYIESLFATHRGRAHVLNQAAEAEDSDEGQVFEQLLTQVDDPRLHKLIQRHAADEKKHAELFRECVKRQGVEPGPVAEVRKKVTDALVAVGVGPTHEAVADEPDVEGFLFAHNN